MYLVCYPQGGWNDMMSRIWYCHQYCQQTGRMLVIDTTKNWFRDDLSFYLSLSLPNMYNGDVSQFITTLYATERVFPKELEGMNNDDLSPIVWKAPGHMETDTGIILSTRLHQVYEEKVVVYADCGSHVHINPILCHTLFSQSVLQYVLERYKRLPKGYASVHIRHTDYKSPVDDFIKEHRAIFSNTPLFIASDHYPTIQLFQREFGAYSFSSIPSVPDGKNIHESTEAQSLRTSKDAIRAFNLDTIADFLLLACGDDYYYSSNQSGFSRSVYFLHQEKGLVKWLLPFIE